MLTERGSIEFVTSLIGHSLPNDAGLAPDGKALWYIDSVSGRAVLIDLPSGRVRAPLDARSFAWSPGGRYLAAATDRGIVVSSWPQGAHVATIPVVANTLSWTRAASTMLDAGRRCSMCRAGPPSVSS